MKMEVRCKRTVPTDQYENARPEVIVTGDVEEFEGDSLADKARNAFDEIRPAVERERAVYKKKAVK